MRIRELSIDQRPRAREIWGNCPGNESRFHLRKNGDAIPRWKADRLRKSTGRGSEVRLGKRSAFVKNGSDLRVARGFRRH